MAGKYHLGGKVPVKQGFRFNETNLLTFEGHNWNKPLIGGPQDIGFKHSYISTGGIQEEPYAFFRNGYLTINTKDAVFWKPGFYDMPMGTSRISDSSMGGEGDADWDSSAYNQIVVNETMQFIDSHLQEMSDDPMFMYVALGAVHKPFTPPNKYMNTIPVAGVYPNPHKDLLMEMDLAVGSIVNMIEEKGIAEDTVIIFTSDNGGIKQAYSSGVLRGTKGEIYEGGHRVPLIIRHDGVYPEDETRDSIVGLNDIFTTLCDIASVNKWHCRNAHDSVSFAKYIKSRKKTSGLRVGQSTWRTKEGIESYQTNRWKVIRRIIRNEKKNTFSSKKEFYDLKNDIGETNDLSGVADYQEIMKKMLERVRKDGMCRKDTETKFELTEGLLKGSLRKCSWFQNDVERCDEYQKDGNRFCPSICGVWRDECNLLGYYWLDTHGMW